MLPTSLRRTLRFKDLTFLGIGAIVGAGIFSTIGQAVAHGGAAVSMLFVGTAVSCALSALCYAQFASILPKAGSAYSYVYHSLGRFMAWIVGWNLILEYAVSNVAVAISWSEYFTSFARGFSWHVPKNFQWGVYQVHLDFPAFMITWLVTWLCYVGIQESKRVNNILVIIKLLVLCGILAIGIFYIDPAHWQPWAPGGYEGVMYGLSSVFFAYIGFDAISTTGEECLDPERDIPKAIMASLLISTVLYVSITLVITGVVPYHLLGVADPLAFIFEYIHLPILGAMVSFISLITLSSVLLVYQLGQPRIWYAMSTDRLLPAIFSSIHRKYQTPWFATLVMGALVSLGALTADLKEVVDLTSMGTLFAFALVCGGLMYLEKANPNLPFNFRIWYWPSRVWVPAGMVLAGAWVVFHTTEAVVYFQSSWIAWFLMASCITAIYYNVSFLPFAGFCFNIFFMHELGGDNWLRFGVWVALGMVIFLIQRLSGSVGNNKANHT